MKLVKNERKEWVKPEEEVLKILNELTLDQIDEKDKKIIMRMLGNKELKTFAEYDIIPLGIHGETLIKVATYTQNYLILKYLLNIRDNNTSQSQKIIEQN